MSHLIKVAFGSIVIGVVLGLIVCGMVISGEEIFAASSGGGLGRRGGPMTIPMLIGAATGWGAMKLLERHSGLAGSWLIFLLASLGGAAAFGIAIATSSGQLAQVSGEKMMAIALAASAGYVGTATWMAHMDE